MLLVGRELTNRDMMVSIHLHMSYCLVYCLHKTIIISTCIEWTWPSYEVLKITFMWYLDNKNINFFGRQEFLVSKWTLHLTDLEDNNSHVQPLPFPIGRPTTSTYYWDTNMKNNMKLHKFENWTNHFYLLWYLTHKSLKMMFQIDTNSFHVDWKIKYKISST